MKSKIHFILFCFLFQLIGISNGYSQKITSVLKVSEAYIINQKTLPDFVNGDQVHNSLFSESSLAFEVNFLKNNFIGVCTSNDRYFLEYQIQYDTSKLDELKGKMLPYEGDHNSNSIYVGGRIHTFKKFNQTLSFSCGVSHTKGHNFYIKRAFISNNYAGDYWISLGDVDTKNYNYVIPLMQANYDFNLFKNRIDVGLKFSTKVFPQSGWRYYYGITLGYNFKKLYPHKEDFKSFADFITVDKEDKAKWNDVKDFKNTIQLEYSAPFISYWGFPLFRLNLPGISYQRNFSKHLFSKSNFNCWGIPYSWNYNIHSLEKWDDWDIDSTEIFSSRNFKTISSAFGYRIDISQFANQNFSLAIGASYSWGLNGKLYSDVGWFGEIKEYNVSYLSPVLEIEYNINPIKNHLNFGVHSRAKYYRDFGYEFDFGIHAGVNF